MLDKRKGFADIGLWNDRTSSGKDGSYENKPTETSPKDWVDKRVTSSEQVRPNVNRNRAYLMFLEICPHGKYYNIRRSQTPVIAVILNSFL